MNESDVRSQKSEVSAGAGNLTSDLRPLTSGRYHFAAPENVARLHEVLLSWQGTPFYKFSKAKGATGGTDCLGFLEGALIEAGVIDPFEFPRSPDDYSRHLRDEKLNKILDYLRGIDPDPQSTRIAEQFEELTLEPATLETRRGKPIEALRLTDPMPGDVLVYKDHSVFHLPIVFAGRKFFHCAWPMGVSEGNMDDATFAPYLKAAFRARSESQ